jgi:hypothetical protein
MNGGLKRIRRHTGGWKNVQPSRGHANPCLHGFTPATGTGANLLGPRPEGRAELTERLPFANVGIEYEPDKVRVGAGWE